MYSIQNALFLNALAFEEKEEDKSYNIISPSLAKAPNGTNRTHKYNNGNVNAFGFELSKIADRKKRCPFFSFFYAPPPHRERER